MDRLARTLIQVRSYVWWSVLVVAAGLWWVSRPIAFDQSMEGFFPPNHPDLVRYQNAKQLFGSDDIVFVVYDDDQLWSADGMLRLETLSRTLAEVDGAARLESLHNMPVPWKVDAAVRSLVSDSTVDQLLGLPKLIAGLSTVGTEVRALADRSNELDELRQRVCASPLFRNVLVSPDGKSTAVLVTLKSRDQADPKQAVRDIRRSAEAFGNQWGLTHVAVAGPPVLLADGFIMLERDNWTLGLIAMVLMGVTMLVAVRGVRWAILPVLSGGTAWLVTQQLLNWWELKLTLSAGPVIAQSIILCMPAVSHLAMHYQQALEKHIDPQHAALETLTSMFAPISWCTLTATAGYLALFSSAVRPVIQFGLIMAACNLLAGILAYALAPAAMRFRPVPQRGPKTTEVAGRVSGMTAWAIHRPLRTMMLVMLPATAISVGMARLEFESNYIRIFKARSRVATDYDFVETRMGGIGIVELVIPAPQKMTDEWIRRLDESAARLAADHADVVTTVLTLADVVKESPSESEVPKTKNADAQRVLDTKLRLLNTPAYAHFVNNFWNASRGTMRLLVRIRETVPAESKQRTFDSLAAQLRTDMGVDAVEVTGLSHLMTQVTRAIITTQFQSAGWSTMIILVMLWVALRSLRLAVLALLPTCLAVGLVLGVMGWLNVRIDLSTAMVTSIALGLSVDDTFHCLLGWQRELRAGRSPLDALRASFAGTGPGVILSSSAVSLGFLALIFSEFVPTANFGWLIAVATLGGSLGNLLILPASLALMSGRSSPQSRSDD